MIDDPQGKGAGGGTMPFDLWAAQEDLLWELVDHPLIFILKARQLGISWEVCAYVLWVVAFHDGKVGLLLSQGEAEAMELLRRVVAMFDRLPEWFRELLPSKVAPTNTTTFTLSNGSVCRSLPATKKAGSSYTASVVVMDEFAKLPWPEDTLTAIKPTIDAGGQLIILSTAFGVGNLFHDLWMKFSLGTTRWKTFFLSWRARPERDQAWYDRTLAESNDPAKHKQEYPLTSQEAFQASGHVRFPNEWIEAQARNLARPMAPGDMDYPAPLATVPGLSIYKPRLWGRKYVIGADVAEGDVDGDADAATVVDRETREEFALLHGRWEPAEYARHLATLAEHYDATIVVERNNHGHAAILKLLELCPERVALGPDNKHGWPTTATTKPQMIDFIAEGLRTGTIVVRSKRTLDEMQIYQVLSGGRTGAPSGKHDDCVMGWGVALGWIKLGIPARLLPGKNPYAGNRGSRSGYGGR